VALHRIFNGEGVRKVNLKNPKAAMAAAPSLADNRRNVRRTGMGAACAAMLALAASPAAADALSTPSLTGPLVANPNPVSFDAGPLGKIYVSGVASGFGAYTSEPQTPFGDQHWRWDATNGQVIVQKTDGLIQFYVQAGAYDLPALGTTIVSSGKETSNTFGVVPVAYLKIAPTDTFNIQVGKLPTLFGAEYTFSFENMNVERGLLWNQEPAISRGVQANYTIGPLALSLSWNDGLYSNKFDWLSGSAAWTIDPANSLSFVGGGNLGTSTVASFVTAPYQNNSDIYNLIYTHTEGPWTITPYFQMTHVAASTALGLTHEGNSYSGAVLVNYNLNASWNLAARVEYIDTTGSAAAGAPSLLYGPGSKAWSFTVTPTYQYKVFFIRPEASYVTVSNATPGDVFGSSLSNTGQFRALLEAGVLF
jgi:hypothetical protein